MGNDEEDNFSDDEAIPYVEPFDEDTPTALVPTDVKIETDDPIDVLGNPNVSNIILPPFQEPYDFIKSEDRPEEDINFEVSDSRIIWDEDNKDLIPLELDDNKIVLTDDGDVILTERGNIQIEYNTLAPLSEGMVALPSEEKMEVGTRNLVLKRKTITK